MGPLVEVVAQDLEQRGAAGSMTIETPKPTRRRGIVSPPGISETARPTSDTARPASFDPFFTTRFAVPSNCRPLG